MRPLWRCLLVLAAAAGEHSPIYVDNDAGQTVADDDISARDRAEIQEDLLHVLGLHRRPRPAQQQVASSAPQFLMDVYNSIVDDDTGDLKLDPNGVGDAWRDFNITTTDREVIEKSDMIMSFINHDSRVFKNLSYPRSQLLWFDLTEAPLDEDRLLASLRVYQAHSYASAVQSGNAVIRIHQLVRGENRSIHLKELDSRPLVPDYVGWLTFNVSRAADLWRAFPDDNLGLFMEVLAGDGSPLVPAQAGVVDSFGQEARQPFLTAFFNQPGNGRPSPNIRFKRRASGKRRRKNRHRQQSSNHLKRLMQKPELSVCQKRSLYVSFRDLGWQDWIIAPDGYAAFFCTGPCAFPLNSQMNATNHAIVQTLTHLLEPFQYPKPSCAPTKLKPISVLYFDDNQNVVLRKYNNMMVSTCGCH